jgi:hypothetical protein
MNEAQDERTVTSAEPLEPRAEPDVDSIADGTASTEPAGEPAWPFGLDSVPPSREHEVSNFARFTPQ